MQTFRAYLQDDTGELIWAAWIDAGHQPLVWAAGDVTTYHC